jgi:hypothetical protein
MSDAVLWAQPPENDEVDDEQDETLGEVDETFAARRLRRWLQGMFGPAPNEPQEPTDQ